MTENTTAFNTDRIESRALDSTTAIITAGLHANRIDMSDVGALIGTVYAACLACLAGTAVAPEKPAATELEKPTAAQVRASIKPAAITSFEDGKAYKSMKRHLRMRGLTPEQYRTKWGLPADYPMVATDYSAQRSALAKSIGLGVPRGTKLDSTNAPKV